MKILMVAEKPAIAQAIAEAMAGGRHDTRRGTTPVHEFSGQFRGQHAFFKVTSVIGHVFSTDFPSNFGWNVDPRILFDAPVEKIEANDKAHVPKHLKNEAVGCDALILWLDNDREGENICFEVIDTVKHKLNRPHQILRAKFSAVTKQDIDRAMKNLGPPNKNEALAVDARQELDLKVGVAFTRFQTGWFHYKYGNLDSNLISYGPCQIPTLGFCVDRYDQIQSFKPEPYFVVQPVVDRQGARWKLSWERQRILRNRQLAESYLEKVKDCKWATLLSATTSKKSKPRPTPLNTVELLKVCSKSLGISPHKAMQVAERLYIAGFVSYPRTESTSYPEHFDFDEALRPHRSHPLWGEHVRALLDEGAFTQPKRGHDAGDHPPITPTRAAQEGELTGTDWKIYEYITRHFIGSVSPDNVIQKHQYAFDIAGEKFNYKGKGSLVDGFTAVMPWLRIPPEKSATDMKQGQQYPVTEVTLQEGKTSPPDFLSEWELIGLMEKHGIGTDASIPVHIENICTRNYVQVDSHSRTLKPTNLGIALVHGYARIDPELYLPKVRASIEQAIGQIALGQAKFEDVVRNSIDTFKKKFDYFVSNINLMDELFEASFSKLTDMEVNTRMKPKCGVCNRYMKYINLKPHRLYCSTCEQVYSLPKNGGIKMSGTEFTCPLDGFELVVHADPRGKYTYLCPKCFNQPTFPGMTANKTCVECPNVECAHNGAHFVVEPCPSCDFGNMVFDYVNGLRMDCSVCKLAVLLPKNVNKMTVAKNSCEKCKAKMIHFKYNEKNNPLPDKKELEFEACYRCHPVISPLIEIKGISGFHRRGPRGQPTPPTPIPPPRSAKPKTAAPAPVPGSGAPVANVSLGDLTKPPVEKQQHSEGGRDARGQKAQRGQKDNKGQQRGQKQQREQVDRQRQDSPVSTAQSQPAASSADAQPQQHPQQQQKQRQQRPPKPPKHQAQQQEQKQGQPTATAAPLAAAPQQQQQQQQQQKLQRQPNQQNKPKQQRHEHHAPSSSAQQQQQQQKPEQDKQPKYQPKTQKPQHAVQSAEPHMSAASAEFTPGQTWQPKQQTEAPATLAAPQPAGKWVPKTQQQPAPAQPPSRPEEEDEDEGDYEEESPQASQAPGQGSRGGRGRGRGRGGRGGRGRGGRGRGSGAQYHPVQSSQ